MNVQEKTRYLTKSRFKLALECPTKIYYSKPSNGYFDKNQNNDFLQALADGGNQVGEIAKFKYHPNPVGDAITVETLDYEQSVDETNVKLARTRACCGCLGRRYCMLLFLCELTF